MRRKEINTVADLKNVLNSFPDDYPLHLFVGEDDPVFIKDISDYDDACQVELI